MELRLLFLLCCSLAAAQGLNNTVEKPIDKRAITEYNAANAKRADEVEGSGTPPSDGKKTNLAAADIEWEASGIGPDDEDGDVVEGSGSHDGAVPPINMPPVGTQQTTSATRTHHEDVHEIERRPIDEDVRIEEEPTTTRTTPLRESLPEMTTARTPPPTIFEDDRHAPIDVLLKPGILAAVIGGVVVGILAAILLVMFVVYRMRKKDEGSYALDEPKQPPHYSYAYQKAPTKEFYA
uniref:Syndecan n=1 Tax=Parascaris univalens TaxID=6257 RepID=A0A915C0T0_PARUN